MAEGVHFCDNGGSCWEFSDDPCDSCREQELRLREEKASEQLSLLSKLRRTLYLADPYNRERAADSLRRDQGRKGNYELCAPRPDPDEKDESVEDRFGPPLTREAKELLLSETGKDLFLRKEDLDVRGAPGDSASAPSSGPREGKLTMGALRARRSKGR